MRALELIEEKGGEKLGVQNDFKKALQDVEASERRALAERGKAQEAAEASESGRAKDRVDAAAEVLDLGLLKTDPDKLYPIIYFALKKTLKEWEAALEDRPGTFLVWLESV